MHLQCIDPQMVSIDHQCTLLIMCMATCCCHAVHLACYALTCTTSTALGLILSYSGVEGMWEGVNGGGEGSVASQGVWGHSLSGCSNVWCSMFFTLIWLYIVLKEDSHEGSHAGGSGGAAGRLGAADAGLGCMGAYALHRRHRCRNVTLHSAGIETHSHQKVTSWDCFRECICFSHSQVSLSTWLIPNKGHLCWALCTPATTYPYWNVCYTQYGMWIVVVMWTGQHLWPALTK